MGRHGGAVKVALWARRLSQGIFLLLFLLLFLRTESRGANELGVPVRLFLDFDPLLALSSALASRSLPRALLPAGILLLSTFLLGRFFCGWICPLGTLHQMAGAPGKRGRTRTAGSRFRIKYYLLLALLAASLFTAQWAGAFDPLCLLVRSLSLSLYPAFNYAANALLDVAYAAPWAWADRLAQALGAFLQTALLAFRQPHFRQGAALGVLFLGLLALNRVERRFWCRVLCPLGALLGLASRWPLLRRHVAEGCTSCGACDRECQGGAGAGEAGSWRSSECMLCLNCGDACPSASVSFGPSRPGAAGAYADLGRRRVVASLAVGAAAVPLTRAMPAFRPANPEPTLIRPPGSRREPEFLSRCVKCGECMKVCLTGGLQPALFEAGLEGIWSPVLVPRIGYCEFRCTLCGQVCPTGAIRRLEEREKAAVVIGTATIDPGRCLPYAHATSCIVCQEVCPTPTKAVWFEEAEAVRRDGSRTTVKRPRVDLELCIGCGICEAKCPVLGTPAIRVTSLGESRSSENRLLLGGHGESGYHG